MIIEPGLLIVAALALLGGGFAVGRLTGSSRAGIVELKAKLETAQKEREFAQASLDAANAEIGRVTAEREEYGSRVVDHFSATSELMRNLTVQYRAVYDELTRGATSLCPDGSVGLQDGLQAESLGAGDEPDSDDSPTESETAKVD